MYLFLKMLAVMPLFQVKGDNIMLGKPSKLSSTDQSYDSSRANDGINSTACVTDSTDKQPYWQGDLEGFYTISTITIDMYHAIHDTRYLFVGASVMDVTCPGSTVITCGQWRENDTSVVQTFICDFSQPVRFIRIWREIQSTLILHEVSVEGVMTKSSGMEYQSMKSMKVLFSTAIKITMVTECAAACFKTQACTAFSFRQGGQLNCLLATKVSVAYYPNWVTYTTNDCQRRALCN